MQAQEIGVSPYIFKISKDTLAYKSSMDLPEAHWSRGEVTTTMMLFIQNFLEKRPAAVQGNETYELIVPCQFLAYILYGIGYGV